MFGKTGVAQVLYLSCYDLVALEWIDGGGMSGAVLASQVPHVSGMCVLTAWARGVKNN